jgi:hypothetical protein
MSFEIVKSVIDTNKNLLVYNNSTLITKQKYLVYCAIENLLYKCKDKFISYLLAGSRSGGFQHKIFQEYIRLLEKSFPLHYFRDNSEMKVESLLDHNLSLFDGISYFDEIATEKLEVKNGTKEFYIGGRKAAYTKPFYIGKLLLIVDKKSQTDLHDKVIEYTFNKIKMKDITPGTEISVTHLRVPPHYQMGGMVYVNRIRKEIIDQTNSILREDK